ncbi:MAG: hypothetical protein K2N34_06160 [Lachnospiraceae bacterium]|nr:hypothetical protein [Lachnospiraceae bacterium]
MDMQALMPLAADLAKLTNISNNTKCNGDFEKLMQQINEETEIKEMKQFLSEKFNVTVTVSDYSCEATDAMAESYDLYMLDKYDFHGGRNVVISKKSLLRMKTDKIFRQKVYKTIEDMKCTSKLTGGIVKSTGVFIHEDGTGGYWIESDWGNKEDDKKKPLKILGNEIKRIELHGYEESNSENIETLALVMSSLYVQDRRKGLQA